MCVGETGATGDVAVNRGGDADCARPPDGLPRLPRLPAAAAGTTGVEAWLALAGRARWRRRLYELTNSASLWVSRAQGSRMARCSQGKMSREVAAWASCQNLEGSDLIEGGRREGVREAWERRGVSE